ncbi:CPBP family intramembrane glutamic endopeptidase [Streptococcus pluranimalium]|uniref:CPBP family intramembrane glutamic endopeptidase n=1 Tax=Streptococcus pluranimalium TaxID=82348 RepID=UPI0039FC5B1F
MEIKADKKVFYLIYLLISIALYCLPNFIFAERFYIIKYLGIRVYDLALPSLLWVCRIIFVIVTYFWGLRIELFKSEYTFSVKTVLRLVILGSLLYLFNLFMAGLQFHYFPNLTNSNQQSISLYYHIMPSFFWVDSVVLGPYFEELTFRGLSFAVFPKWLAILIAIFGFSLWHTFSLSAFLYLPTALTMTILYCKTKNLRIPILVHMIHNLISVTIFLSS